MGLLDDLTRAETWEAFYHYKTSLVCPKDVAAQLRSFIDCRAWLPVCRRIEAGESFPLPRKTVISKLHSDKKRIVYIYPDPENTVLKLLTWLLLRRYDGRFADGLYSFRPGRTAKDAIRSLLGTPGLRAMYAYKTDISNYFNSIDLQRFLPVLGQTLSDDPTLLRFLRGLLSEPNVRDGEALVTEQKGIMAGTPLSAFYANLYLREVDEMFCTAGVPYARYSDDIILFASTEAEVRAYAVRLHALLHEKGLTVNPNKEACFSPSEGWTFLGFRCADGTVDIAPATVDKLKAKMRRKTRALSRWRDRTGHTGEQAAAAFIRVFNRKLLECPMDRELSWSHWFFSVINTTDTLHVIDRYAQDCMRVLVSGRRTKARFNVRYETLKALGYRSLVHAYYDYDRLRHAPQETDLANR